MKNVFATVSVLICSCNMFFGQSFQPELLKDMNSGLTNNAEPAFFVASENNLFFVARSGNNFSEYYPTISDRTANGTDSITFPGLTYSGYFGSAVLGDNMLYLNNSKLFFVNSSGGTEIMDGLNALQTGKMNDKNTFELNGKLYFWAEKDLGMEMYMTDGTAAGTGLFMDFSTTGSSRPGVQKSFFKYGNIVYFLAKVNNDLTLWKTDGTIANTTMVTNLYSSYTGDYYKFPFDQLVDGKIFLAYGGFFDPVTETFTQLNPGPGAWMAESFRLLNDSVYFLKVVNGPGIPEYNIWKSGSDGGSVMVSNDYIADTWVVPPMKTTAHTSVKGKLIFVGNDLNGGANDYLIWSTDGTAAGTEIIDSVSGMGQVTALYAAGDKRVAIQFGNNLYLTDGSADSTELVIAEQSNVTPNFYMDERKSILYFCHKMTSSIGAEPYYINFTSTPISGGGSTTINAPTNLSLVPTTKQTYFDKMALSWQDNSTNEDGFIIERSLNNATWITVDSVGVDIENFLDTGLLESTAYFYRVSAYNALTNSGYSNVGVANTGTSGIASNEVDKLRLFPNPTSDNVYISGNFTNAQVLFYSSTMQLVKTINLNTNSYVSVAGLPAGIYFVQVDKHKLSKLVIR